VLALAVGAGLAIWQATRAERSADGAQQQATSAGAARRMLKELMTTVLSREEILKPAGRDAIAQMLHLRLERIDREYATAPLQRTELRGLIGELFGEMSRPKDAIAVLSAQINELLERIPQDHIALGTSYLAISGAYTDLGDASSEESALRAALSALEQADLTIAAPSLAEVASYLGGFLLKQGKLADAEQILMLWHKRLAQSAGNSKAYGRLCRGLGRLNNTKNQISEAVKYFEDALRIFDGDPNTPIELKASTSNDLANGYLRLGRYRDSETLLKRITGEMAHELGEKHVGLAKVRIRLANLLSKLGQHDEAERIARLAASTLGELPDGVENSFRGYAVTTVGEVLLNSGRPAIALERFEFAAALQRKDKTTPVLNKIWTGLLHSRTLISVGNYSAAEQYLHEVDTLATNAFGPDAQELAKTAELRARIKLALGDPAKAIALLNTALVTTKLPQANIDSLHHSLRDTLALSMLMSGDTVAAVEHFSRRVAELERANPQTVTPELESSLRLGLGRACLASDQAEKARFQFARVADLLNTAPESIDLAYAKLQLALALLAVGEKTQANVLVADAQRVYASNKKLGRQYLVPLEVALIDK
jgi:tetratricopeptide (TPR) repeat protein